MYRGEFHSSARDKLRRIVFSRRGAAFVIGGATLLAASPAAARDFNCFEWVAGAARHAIHHRPHHAKAAHVIGVKAPARPHPHRIRPLATHMVRRPVACPVHEAALASPIPGAIAGAAAPETPQELLAALAGPPPAATETAADTVDTAPAAPEEFFPGFPGGSPPNGLPPEFGFPSPPGFPGGPPVISVPPIEVTPPIEVSPPVVIPPDTPGVPVVPTPPGGPPVPPPGGPGGPGGPGPTGGVPEPGAWVMMLLGFGAVGAALRRRSAALRA